MDGADRKLLKAPYGIRVLSQIPCLKSFDLLHKIRGLVILIHYLNQGIFLIILWRTRGQVLPHL